MTKNIFVPFSKRDPIEDDAGRGIRVKKMLVGGAERSFAYYIPDDLKKNSPVLFLGHGAYWNHEVMRRATGFEFETLAEKFKFAVVYPDSYGAYWNDGRTSFLHYARELALDEEEFF